MKSAPSSWRMVLLKGFRTRGGVTDLGLAAIALWGFAQLALSATVYRYATLEASLRLAALAATAMVASFAL